MLRKVNSAPKLDKGMKTGKPPDSMLLAPGCTKYGDILKRAGTNKHGKYLEHAGYNNKGEFCERTLSVGPHFSFYFRSRRDDMNEEPFVVEYRIR